MSSDLKRQKHAWAFPPQIALHYEALMELHEFSAALAAAGDDHVSFTLPHEQALAPHFHVTEVGKVTKDFVDCGGTRRTTVTCILQTLVAADTDHRLTAAKLAGIIEKSSVLNLSDDTPVEVEIQAETIGIYSVEQASTAGGALSFNLAAKQTACLAPDRCGIDDLNILDESCSGETGCC